jgi:hypothetical protein
MKGSIGIIAMLCFGFGFLVSRAYYSDQISFYDRELRHCEKFVPANQSEAGITPLLEIQHGTFELEGTKDGKNTKFSAPCRVIFGENGRPIGTLSWRTAPLNYTEHNQPDPGTWTVVGESPQWIIVGIPPEAGDGLKLRQ